MQTKGTFLTDEAVNWDVLFGVLQRGVSSGQAGPCVTDCNHNNEGLGDTGAHGRTGKEKANISKAVCV